MKRLPNSLAKTGHYIRNLMPLGSLVAVTMAAQGATPAYDNLYVSGDSYCDVGNLFTATRGAMPSAPYYNGRFSNGPIWVDHVAGFLNLPLTPSLLGGTDYAFGGAWVTASQPFSFATAAICRARSRCCVGLSLPGRCGNSV